MIGWFSYLMSRVMVTKYSNVHYYERYVNLVYSLDGTLESRRAGSRDLRGLTVPSITCRATWTANIKERLSTYIFQVPL